MQQAPCEEAYTKCNQKKKKKENAQIWNITARFSVESLTTVPLVPLKERPTKEAPNRKPVTVRKVSTAELHDEEKPYPPSSIARCGCSISTLFFVTALTFHVRASLLSGVVTGLFVHLPVPFRKIEFSCYIATPQGVKCVSIVYYRRFLWAGGLMEAALRKRKPDKKKDNKKRKKKKDKKMGNMQKIIDAMSKLATQWNPILAMEYHPTTNRG